MSKTPFGAFRQVFAVCCAHNLSPLGDKFHTCSLRSVFCQVQKVNCPAGAREATLGCAPAENFFDFICCHRRQTL